MRKNLFGFRGVRRAVSCLALLALSASAADYTWLASPVSANWLTDANWDQGAWDENATANKAVFGASSQTSVDVNGDVTASSVAVSGADYAFGGTGTLEVNGSFNVAAGNTVTVNGPLAQTGPLANRLVKDGDGTLVVKGDSTLGYFAIHGGTVKFDGGMHAITNVSTGAGESAQGLSLAKGTMVVEGGATVMTTANSMYAANSGVDMYVTNGVFDVWSLKSDYLNAFKDNIGSFAPRRSRLTLKDEGTFVVKAFRISKAASNSYPDNPDEVYLGPGGRFVFRNFCMDEASGSKFYATMNLDGGTLITTNTPTDKANGAKLNRFSTGRLRLVLLQGVRERRGARRRHHAHGQALRLPVRHQHLQRRHDRDGERLLRDRHRPLAGRDPRRTDGQRVHSVQFRVLPHWRDVRRPPEPHVPPGGRRRCAVRDI